MSLTGEAGEREWRLDVSLLQEYGMSAPAPVGTESRLPASGVEPDHPKVRDGRVCPLCHGDKELGLFECWECYKMYRMRDGNAEAGRLIARAETELHSDGAEARHEAILDRYDEAF